MKKLLKEFKEFAIKGNMIELAVGIIIGTTFNAIVNSIVKDIFMPIVGMLTGGRDYSGLALTIGNASINYGLFIQTVINFLITAVSLFFVIKVLNSFNRKKDEPVEVVVVEEEKPDENTVLLREIKELLCKINEKN